MLVLLAVLLLLPLAVAAQELESGPGDIPTAASAPPLSVKDLENRLAALHAISTPNPQETAAIELYQAAINQAQAAEREDEIAAGFKQSLENAPQQQAQLQQELERLQADEPEEVLVTEDVVVSLAELERQLDQAQANRRVLQNKLEEMQARLTNERLRPDLVIEEVSRVKLKLQEIAEQIRSRKIQEGADIQGAAWRASARATEQALNSRLNRFEMERLTQGPRLELLNLQVDQFQSQIKHADRLVQGLQQRLSDRRSVEAAEAARATAEVKREATGKHPLIQGEAGDNQELSAELGSLTRELERAIKRREYVGTQLQVLGRALDRARQQLEIAGYDEALGKLLRNQREELPTLKRLKSNADETRSQVARARLEQFRLEDRRETLLSAGRVDALITSAQPEGLGVQQLAALRLELEQLLADRVQLVEQLQAAYGRLERVLGDLELDQQQFLVKVTQYAELLDRHLLWMPSTHAVDLDTPRQVLQGLRALVSPSLWAEPAGLLYASVQQQPFRVLLIILVIVALLAVRKRMRRLLEKVAPKVGNVRHDSFLHTLRAFYATLFLAAPWIVLTFTLAWLLKIGPDETGDAFGQGFLRVALLLALLQPLRYLFVENGLAEVHFGWDPANTRLLRRNLRWLLLFLPLSFIVGLTESQVEAFYRDYMGRAAAMLGALVFAVFAWRVLDPQRGLFRRSVDAAREAGWSLHSLWRPLALAMCLVLITLDFEGYYYTELRLVSIYYQSALVGVAVLLLYHLSERWLLVAERRLAFARARAKRQAAQDSRAAKEAAEAAGETLQESPEQEQINLDTINEQTRSLLALGAMLLTVAGLYSVWSQLLPAVGRLDEVVLWQSVQNVAGAQQLMPVSVWDVVLALLVVVLTLVAGRNLPGLLEIAVLQPLALDPGSRYAIAKISRYMIYTAGALVTIGMMGVAWGDVQWLVAAMGVGLGFGLQEIFANFISGLMILFERPIRIGDTVTVGDISGTVSRIRIRATTITDFDNKELLVPNKAFVTDPLINWTLSDPITRVKVPVGIAYGSDTERAYRIMMDVLHGHPDVIDEPKPTVFFVGFGDSSLDFEIRAFVPERIKRMPLTHDLHMALDREFRKAGIEIPFPQRDLHLRSVSPEVEIKTAGKEPKGSGNGPHKQA